MKNLNKSIFDIQSIHIINAKLITILIFLIIVLNYLIEFFIACITILLFCFVFKNAKYLTVVNAAFITALINCHQTYITDLIFTPKMFVVADLMALTPIVIEDDLIDARCQSKCLYEFEKSHKVFFFF